MREDISVRAEADAIGKGCGAVAARLHKAYIGNLHDGYAGLFVKVRDRESRKPQDFLHFGQTPGSVEAYLSFLKSGGSRFPLETLQAAGVDMTTPAPIESTLRLFERRLAELEELLL